MTIRGAPFDENNLFNRPSVDGGKLEYQQTADHINIDGGNLNTTPTYQNGGLLPKAGTATYVPDPDYGPNGPRIGR